MPLYDGRAGAAALKPLPCKKKWKKEKPRRREAAGLPRILNYSPFVTTPSFTVSLMPSVVV
jgi:hypothetical protein